MEHVRDESRRALWTVVYGKKSPVTGCNTLAYRKSKKIVHETKLHLDELRLKIDRKNIVSKIEPSKKDRLK